MRALFERCRIFRRPGNKGGRALHCNALVIKPQTIEASELLAVSGAAWSAVMALRHDNTVAAVSVDDRCINGQYASIRGSKLDHRACQKIGVVSEYRCNQRSTTASDESEGFGLVFVGNNGCRRAKNFGFVHRPRF